MLAGSNWLWVGLMITLSILVRLDNVLFALILFPIYFFYQRNNTFNLKALIFLLGAILIWVSIGVIVLSLSNFNSGFQTFYDNLFNRINPLNNVGYVLNGFKTIQTSHLILILLICYLSLFYKKQMSIQLFTRKQSLFIGILIYVVLKFLFFPDLTTRLYLPVYIISIVFIIEEIGDRSTNLLKNYRT